MKRGNAGLTGCCGGFGLWGVHVNCPNPLPAEHSTPDNDPVGSNFPDTTYHLTSRGFAYGGRGWQNEYDQATHKDVLPEIWTPDDADTGNKSWHAFAAKLPTSYPGEQCEKYPPTSSATKDESGTGEWQSDLGEIMAAEAYDLPGSDPLVNRLDTPRGHGFVYRSRAIYTDGAQTHLAYCVTGVNPETDTVDGLGNHFITNISHPPRSRNQIFGDTVIIDIAHPDSPTTYHTHTLAGIIYDSTNGTHASLMEGQYSATFGLMYDLFEGDLEISQFAGFQTSYGKRYAVFSTYHPSFTFGNSESGYQAVRLKYDGTRRDDDDVEVDNVVEVFATYSGDHGNPAADLGKDDTTYAGDYIVVLPSIRCYLDSAVDSDDSPDEPYVCAIHKDFTSTKIICSKWNSKIYRPGVGDETDFSGLADGTLSSSEVAVAQTIMDEGAPPAGYEDEVFDNPRVWCFNRVWDSVAKKNVNTLLLTTEPDDPPTTTADDVIADFETDLNHGLPAGIAFTTSGGDIDDNYWIADNATTFSEDTIYTADGGSWVARNNMRVNFAGVANLSLTVTLTDAGDVTFPFLFDNRELTDRDSTDPFSGVDGGIPDLDNTLSINVDGAVADDTIFAIDAGSGYVAASGLIDNNEFGGDDAAFATYRMGKLSLTAGTHTIRFTTTRGSGYDRCLAQIGYISFPTLMLGDDIDGLTRWYSVDGVLRKVPAGSWAWAARDEEVVDGATTPVSSRAKTVPHFITMDGAGRILIGNPHYIVRLNRDGTLDKTHGNARGAGFEGESTGWRRFTASPNIDPPPSSCLDPDGLGTGVDGERDPLVGAMQILPVGNDTYQVIGVNGSLDRDTTIFPFDKSLWTYKHPISGKINQEIFVNSAFITTDSHWNQRVHRWVISNNGKDAEPCIEVLWRPTMHQPAYPAEPGTTDAERFPHPPYRSDFADESTTSTDYSPVSVRWRDPWQDEPRLLNEGTISSVVGTGDYVISAGSAVNDNVYDGAILVIGDKSGNVGGYNHTTKEITASGDFDGSIEPGFGYKIIKTRPRWAQTNQIIPRTGSDAWSQLPQGAWVRNTDDPPAYPDANWWDPDTSPADILAMQDAGADPPVHPRGGPWGSAQWVLVQARFNPVGALWIFYEFNIESADVCSGHGADEDDPVDVPARLPSTIQTTSLTKVVATTDFDAVQCECGCC